MVTKKFERRKFYVMICWKKKKEREREREYVGEKRKLTNNNFGYF